MDTEVLDRPEVTEVTLTQAAVAPLKFIEAGLIALADTYRSASFDLATTKGLDEAKAARNDLRERGRYAVQRATAEFKRQANDAKRAVDDLADKLIAITEPIEVRIDGEIKAREKEIADERAAKLRAEQERRDRNEASIAVINKYLDHARGMPSARIQAGIDVLSAIDMSATVDRDYIERATAAKAATLSAMRTLHAQTVEAEQERERLEAQRIEQERQAEALRVQREEIERQQAEMRKQAQELAEQREAMKRAEERWLAEEAAKPQANTEAQDSQQVLKADPETDDATDREQPAIASPSVGSMGAGQPADAGPVADEPVITIGAIGKRLGFTVTAQFLAGLGIAGKKERIAMVYPASDWPRICDALVAHINTLKGK